MVNGGRELSRHLCALDFIDERWPGSSPQCSTHCIYNGITVSVPLAMGGSMIIPHNFTRSVSRSMQATTLRWPIRNIVGVIRWILSASSTVPSSKLNLQIIDLLLQILQFPQLVIAMRPLKDIRHSLFPVGRSLIRVYSRLLPVVHVLLFPSTLPFPPPMTLWGSLWLISSPKTLSNIWTFHSWIVPSSLKATSRVGFS